jgi:hypothetical protein
MNRQTAHIIVLLVRWTARLAGALLAGLILLIIIGESISNGLPPLRVLLSPIHLGIWGCLIGIALGWKWEALGGLTVLISCAVMNLYEYAMTGGWLLGGAFPLFLIPGVLLPLSAGLHAWEKRTRTMTP